MKKVFKYATGKPIPEGAIYLSTVKQTEVEVEKQAFDGSGHADGYKKEWERCWLVWHYFLVDTDE